MGKAITEVAMLVKVKFSFWEARKLDKRVTTETNERYDVADGDGGRYNKPLLAKDAIKDMKSCKSKITNYIEFQTLPWYDDGTRVLPAANYLEFTKNVQPLIEDFNKAKSDFVLGYSDYVADQKTRLKGLWNEADYPAANTIGNKFGVRMHIDPIPYAKDFRVTDLSAEDITQIKKDLEARESEIKALFNKELWTRLYERVEKIVERLSDPENTFRDSLIGNLRELADLLPKLNINGDKDLQKTLKEINGKLCSYEPEVLRTDPDVRKKTAEDARAILDAMAGYCEE